MKHGHRGTILLVEDEVVIATAEKAVLEKHGYTVIVAGTGERALGIFCAQSSVDLAVLDINLGTGIDGVETARYLLRIRELPILFLSSFPVEEIERLTQDIPAYRLSKPCTNVRLVKTVETALPRPAQGQSSVTKRVGVSRSDDNLETRCQSICQSGQL
ncbi:MAG: response regulator [Spirochaetaceae bacterium]